VAVVALLLELLARNGDLLGIPRSVSAMRVASRPRVWPSASTTYQRCSISFGLAV
jgi:hypothetical protein